MVALGFDYAFVDIWHMPVLQWGLCEEEIQHCCPEKSHDE